MVERFNNGDSQSAKAQAASENALSPMSKRMFLAFMVMLALVLALSGCGSSTESDAEEESSGSEAVAQVEADEEDEEEVEEEEIEEEEVEEVELTTLDGTEATSFVADMYAGMLETESADVPDPLSDGTVLTYEVSTSSYALTVQASAETDEISYIKFEVLAWDEDVSGINLFGVIYRLLELDEEFQYITWYQFITDYTDGEGTVSGEAEEDFDLDYVTFKLSASDNDLPILEVTAL